MNKAAIPRFKIQTYEDKIKKKQNKNQISKNKQKNIYK
jgi:hypothetical protein